MNLFLVTPSTKDGCLGDIDESDAVDPRSNGGGLSGSSLGLHECFPTGRVWTWAIRKTFPETPHSTCRNSSVILIVEPVPLNFIIRFELNHLFIS